jgi:hypothetical protein
MRDVMKRRTGFDMLKLSRWDIVGINVQWEGSIGRRVPGYYISSQSGSHALTYCNSVQYPFR